MTMRWLRITYALVVLLSLLVTAGCGTRSASPPAKAVEQSSDKGLTVAAPIPMQTPTSAVPETVQACRPLERTEVLGKMRDITRLPASDRLALMVGPARAFFADEAAYVAEGWPASVQLMPWRSDRWLTIEMKPAGPDRTVANLVYVKSTGSKEQMAFEFVCTGGNWLLQNLGPDGYWLTPDPPVQLDQSGPLTEVLAKAIVAELVRDFGRPRSRSTATGNYLERSRRWAVWYYQGQTGGMGSFRERTDRLQLVPISPDTVEGAWLDGAGGVVGEKIRFRRVSGLWKVDEVQEFGKWPDPPTPMFRWVEWDLLGYKLGATKEQLKPYVSHAEQDYPNNTWYDTPRFAVLDFTEDGHLWQVEIESGGTSYGLNIGDPVSSVEAVLGKPTSSEAGHMTYRKDGPSILHVYHKDGYVVRIGLAAKK